MVRKFSLMLALFVPLTGCEKIGETEPAPVRETSPSEATGSEQVPPVEPAEEIVAVPASDGPGGLSICSFNIQFLGNPRDRDHEALARIMAPYDIVAVQELVAPPCEGTFPDGTPYNPDPEAAEFFIAMESLGFRWLLSEEDTGSGERIHVNSSATEWRATFFRPEKVQVAYDLPGGFLAEDRADNDDYERVPYAFPFRTLDGSADFVLISVHLQPGDSGAEAARRSHELQTIAAWINVNNSEERDFIILGDMNIEDFEELQAATPQGFLSLNDECRPTNAKGDKPYDHVMFSPSFTREIDRAFDMRVVDLVPTMEAFWNLPTPYPGNPYDHNEFRKYYSDHDPVVFRLNPQPYDDDGVALVTRRESTSDVQ